MIIFISGSVNAGKSTTSKLIAEKIDAEWIDVDELAYSIENFNLAKDIPKAIALTIDTINILTAEGKNVVANYVLRRKDYEALRARLKDQNQYYFTLAPKLDIALSDRGRGMNDWEYERIKYHYDNDIANPDFGEIIDNSDLTINETAKIIIEKISYEKAL